MPPKGFKSVTLRQWVYDYYYKDYKDHEKQLLLEKGITNFSGYLTYLLSLGIPEQERKLAH